MSNLQRNLFYVQKCLNHEVEFPRKKTATGGSKQEKNIANMLIIYGHNWYTFSL